MAPADSNIADQVEPPPSGDGEIISAAVADEMEDNKPIDVAPADETNADPVTSPMNSTWTKASLSPQDKEKATQVLAACRDRDLEALASLATSQGGLIEDELRRTAWPILLGCHPSEPSQKNDWTKLEPHREEQQVQLDVDRSFVYYPENESEQRLERRKSELSNLIRSVLRQHPFLFYFQGYHDIVQVFLLVLGADAAESAVARLSLLRIRDFMLPTMSGAVSQIHLLPAILYATDRELYQHLSVATNPMPGFALPATITLYAHQIEEYGDIARLFDYLLASEAAVPIYLFAVIILTRKTELLEIESDDFAMLHHILSKLPKPLDLDGLISRTHTLFLQHPPETLPFRAWSRISAYSVLKTTRDPHTRTSLCLDDAKELWRKHAAQNWRMEKIQKAREAVQKVPQAVQKFGVRHRREVRFTGAAVLVALLAVYFGRTEGAGGWISLVGRRGGELVQQVLRRIF